MAGVPDTHQFGKPLGAELSTVLSFFALMFEDGGGRPLLSIRSQAVWFLSVSVWVKVRTRLQASCDPPVVALSAYAFRSDAFELLIRDARTPDADFDGFDLSRSN
jgi:hypothetical protein